MNRQAYVANRDQRIERNPPGLLIERYFYAADAYFPEDRDGLEVAGPAQIGAANDAAALHLKVPLEDFGPLEPCLSRADAAAFFDPFSCRNAQQFRRHGFQLDDRLPTSFQHG